MEYPWSYDEEWDEFLQNFMFHEEYHYLPDFRKETLLLKLDAPLHGDILTPWPAVEEGARHNHNGDKDMKQEVGGDAAVKKREEALFSSTQHLSTSTSSVHSSLLQDNILAALEGDLPKRRKELKQELGRNTGEKKREVPKAKPLLTFELVAQYFCMPVKQAAEELNVGRTHLKRRCRELGIPQWPHRKVKSLDTLIKNAQELGKPKIEVESLQQKKRLIEERPGHVELDRETKVLRQACFMELFKRRRLMSIQG